MHVLLHGFTGAPSSWDAIRRHLGPSLAPPLPGHGAPPELTWAGAVDALADTIRREGFEGAHLVGYSLGGRLALGLLARHPGIASRATVIGAQPGLSDPRERAARAAADEEQAARLLRDGLPAFVAAWEALPMWASQGWLPADVLARQRAARLAHDPAGLASSLRGQGLGAMPDLRVALAGVRAPVTVMVGREDNKFLAIGRELSAILPGGRLVVVQGSGHNVALEAPEAVVAELA